MIAQIVFLSFLIFIGWMLHSLVNTNYKKRWKTATALLEEPSLSEGEWKLDQYIRNVTWQTGPYKDRKFNGIAFRAINGNEIVVINPVANQLAIDPADPRFENEIAAYRRKAETVVRELNRGTVTDKSPFNKPEPERRILMPEASYLVISNKQAAQMFRSFYNGPGGCQFEGGRMRWWLQGNMLLEQVLTVEEGLQWRLSMVPDRNCD